MLTKDAVHYYSIIRDKFKNSYLAEDANQIIIGIDCDYIDSYEYSYKTLELFYSNQKAIAPFAGLFGIFSYETIHFFEKIEKKEKSQFEFPQFVFANAKAYLHYSKISKMYTFYGDEEKYYNFLENESFTEKPAENEIFYKIETDLDKEKEHFYDIVEKAKEYIKMG